MIKLNRHIVSPHLSHELLIENRQSDENFTWEYVKYFHLP